MIMPEFKVAEIFTSINGEGAKAGQPAVFVRFTGCNLGCSYCDTVWANREDSPFTIMTDREIYNAVKSKGIANVTITGGEPLYRRGISSLLKMIDEDAFLQGEIETNGSISLAPFVQYCNTISFTMDYKLPSSGMENKMCQDNFDVLRSHDTVKFVAGSSEDLDRTLEIIDRYRLRKRVNIYISPVFGKIEPRTIVEFMIENRMNDVNMQLQLHKFIWDPDAKGV